MINNREIEILNNLIKGEKYSFNDIALKYNISNRSARYYVDNVDEILKYLGYSKTEKNKNIIKLDTNQDFKKLYDIFNKTQKLTENIDKEIKPDNSEQVNKMKHLVGYETKKFVNTNNIKKNRGF